jgi:penicillin amidase
VADLLRSWNGESAAGSVGAAAYHVFLSALTHELLGERLGEELLARYLAVPQVDAGAVVFDVVRAADSGGGGAAGAWADPEPVAAAVRASLRETWFRLTYRLGGSRAKWRWGRLHRVGFRSFLPWDAQPGPGPFEIGGSGSTVNTQEYSPQAPFDVRLASTFRFAADTAALDRSLTVLAPGQSEHPGHPHRDDGLAGWLRGQSSVLPTARVLLEDATVSRLLLEPAP